MILKSEDFVGSTHNEKIILSRRDIKKIAPTPPRKNYFVSSWHISKHKTSSNNMNVFAF